MSSLWDILDFRWKKICVLIKVLIHWTEILTRYWCMSDRADFPMKYYSEYFWNGFSARWGKIHQYCVMKLAFIALKSGSEFICYWSVSEIGWMSILWDILNLKLKFGCVYSLSDTYFFRRNSSFDLSLREKCIFLGNFST